MPWYLWIVLLFGIVDLAPGGLAFYRDATQARLNWARLAVAMIDLVVVAWILVLLVWGSGS